MFKRVAKRVKRKEEEEALGLDEDMKEALGMHDTDSDESESDSSEDDGSQSEAGSDDASLDGDEEEGLGLPSEEEELDPAGSDDDAVSDNGAPEEPPMTLEEALRDPIYLVSMDPEVKACVVCPGKLLKNFKMSGVHLSSHAHTRRYTKFVELSKTDDSLVDILDALDAESGSKPAIETTGNSKRAQKRKAKIEAIKDKRTRQKAMKAKALLKKAATAAPSDEPAPSPSKPPQKDKSAGKDRSVKRDKKGKAAAESADVPVAAASKPKKRTKPDTDASLPVAKKPRREFIRAPSPPSASSGKTSCKPQEPAAAKAKPGKKPKPSTTDKTSALAKKRKVSA